MKNRTLAVLTFFFAAASAPGRSQQITFAGQPAELLASDKIALTVTTLGATVASIVLSDDPAKLNPLWDPMRVAREQGRELAYTGSAGHFVCVDGFGPPSPDERSAGMPMHGEAHVTRFEMSRVEESGGSALTFTATLPIVQEHFTRTYHVVKNENVVYVDSELENLMGFDRPVNWGEHATIMAPFLEPNATTVYLSGTRSQNRDYRPSAGQIQQAGGGTQRRLVPGQDFTWPMAPGLDGKTVDLSSPPADAHFLDHATTLLDPTRELEWVAAINTSRHLVYGYVFRRDDYPWLQHWDNYPNTAQLVRGMEFATQPYDVPRRDTVTLRSMFETPVYRWLPAKSKIESHFLLYYARVPDRFRKVDDVRLENGRLILEDRGANERVVLAASRGLPGNR